MADLLHDMNLATQNGDDNPLTCTIVTNAGQVIDTNILTLCLTMAPSDRFCCLLERAPRAALPGDASAAPSLPAWSTVEVAAAEVK